MVNSIFAGVCVLDGTKQPKSLTVSEYPYSDKSRKRQQSLGIYKLDGDRLTIAFRKADAPPEKFKSKPGSGVTLLVLERKKAEPPPKEDESKDDASRLSSGGPKPATSPDVTPAPPSDVRLGTARYRHGSRIESMAVSADGRLAVVAGGRAGSWLVLARTGVRPDRWPLSLFPPDERGSDTEAVGLSPDGKTLAIKDDEFLYFRDAATGKELRKLKYLSDSGGGRSITDWMTFTPDGKQVAATLMGDAIQLIDVETGKVIRTFSPPGGGAASACVFSPDGKRLATARVMRWRTAFTASAYGRSARGKNSGTSRPGSSRAGTAANGR